MLGVTSKLRENGLCYASVTRTRRSPRMRVTLQLVMCNDQGDEESNALHVMLFRTNSIRILFRACRKTTLSVTGASWPPSFLSTVAVLSVLPTPMPCLLTCRPVPGPASVCADCRRGATGDLPSPASATDVPWAC